MIKRVSIRNFRSIVSADFSAEDITVLVGPNDSGKSNVLRALNLFFNSELEPGRRLDFDSDFSGYAKKVKGKAPEIVVDVTFSPPSSYKERRLISWRKTWRASSIAPHSSLRRFVDGTDLTGRGKVGVWLDRLRFEYVPAIKGPDYFVRLLRELHDTFADTIDTDLRAASSGFVANIHKHTNSMSSRLQSALGFSSEVELPANLGSLFEVLEFRTSDVGAVSIPLSSRGDGIKVRHIPVVLKFIADQRNIHASSGHIRADTIWGYEEPENNLELSKAYELRDEFIRYSADTQIFLTTHSPAFYGLCESPGLRGSARHFVSRSNDGTVISDSALDAGVSNLDKQLGLLPLVEPHIRESVEAARRLRNDILDAQRHLPSPSHASVFVEGLTDQRIISSLLGRDFEAKQVKSIVGGGASWVADCLLATVALGDQVGRSVGIFDGDDAGERAAARVDELAPKIRKAPGNIKKIRLGQIKPGRAVLELKKNKLRIPIAIEELASEDVWEHAEKSGWLEARTDLLSYNQWKDPEVSFFSHCNSIGLSDAAMRLLKYRVSMEHKEGFAKLIAGEVSEGVGLDEGLGELRDKLLDALSS